VDQPQPSHMSKFVNTQQDSGGVHVNSGIINNAAFLMTVGGVNPTSKVEVKYGIGWEKSEKVWYRANTKYFASTTKFAAAAEGVMQAAKDVGLTAAETNIVDCAFKATGIKTGECATLVDPKSSSPATGDDPATSPGIGTGDPATGNSDGTTDTSPPKKRRRSIQTTESSCNAAPAGSQSSLGFGLVLAVAGLALTRRSRKR
jgi:thermolysin